MNKVEFGEQLQLENGKEYICYATITENNSDYLYMVNANDKFDIIIVKEIIDNDDLSLEIINDLKTKRHLQDLFEKKYRIKEN